MPGGPPLIPNQPPQRSITFRSVGLGLLIAVGIVCITPFNDYVVNNSYLVGSYFPPIVALAVLAIVLLINGPLHKFAPRYAMSPGELSIVILMALVSCSIPSQGLMRQLIPSMVAPLYYSAQDPKYAQLLEKMQIPQWTLAGESLKSGSEPVVTGFYARLTDSESIPWGLWVKPLLGWGAFTACLVTALVSIACIVRFQWAVNERLAFPIAQLQSLLIAPPRAGKAFNDIFSSYTFWIAAAFVIVIQSSLVLNTYFPTGVPAIPFSYNFQNMLTDQPWNWLPWWLKASTIYFTLLGLTYFTPTRVSFSLWGIPLIVAMIQWPLNAVGSQAMSAPAMNDQQLGAAFAFLGGILWIGRHHWMVVLRSLVGRRRDNDAQGLFLTYRVASIALIVFMIGMASWFMILGASWWLACAIVLMILMAHLITARFVAETGMAYVRMPVNFDQMLTNLPATALTPQGAYAYGIGHYGFMQGARESTLTFALHGIQTVEESGASPRAKRAVPPIIFSTLAIAFIAAAIASIWCYYSYAIPLDDLDQRGVLNVFGTINWPRQWLVEFPTTVDAGSFPDKAHNSWMHIGIGIVVTVILQALTWRFSGWPLLPVGYLLCTYFYITGAAFSIFLGWLAKTIILRFGGATLFNTMKPLFIGLIFGEALSTGLWLVITMLLAANGYEFKVVRFLPQ